MQQHLEDMLHLWQEQRRPLPELVDAVRKKPIQNVVLASKLEKKYKEMGLCKFMGYQFWKLACLKYFNCPALLLACTVLNIHTIVIHHREGTG